MWPKNCGKLVICVNGQCFDNDLAAGHYIMELSSRGETVTVSRHRDMSQCFSSEEKKSEPHF